MHHARPLQVGVQLTVSVDVPARIEQFRARLDQTLTVLHVPTEVSHSAL